ncbi:hypothetical protein B4N89_23910 [Embleya scabrispora]|uniref:DUF3040 domain-containing protein n=1 Tax=Embleya scabrispora TaxID=159449 RepID=A0A1T3P3U5_9ACTN|nr:hypothetical protein [Embleya scabrispora]OPC83580.1 hypothetical protein B4N89_23910 [Embleya scabrispora]
MMEEVRLTPNERRMLEEIEYELRKDEELDLALRTMRPSRNRRRGGVRGRVVPGAGSMPASGRARRRMRRPTLSGTWHVLLLVVLFAAVFAALITTSGAYLVVIAFALIIMGCTTTLVWLCVSFLLRRGGGGRT